MRIGKVRFDMSKDSTHSESDPFAFFLKAVAVESHTQGKRKFSLFAVQSTSARCALRRSVRSANACSTNQMKATVIHL